MRNVPKKSFELRVASCEQDAVFTRNSQPATRNSLYATRNAQRATSPTGFTLIEMITVLTIIIIVLAISIPVWNAMIGGNHLAAAQNQIAAYIASARTDAIYNRQTMGVFFFIDPKTQQTAMAEVQVQTLYQVPPANGSSVNTPSYTSLFYPGTWAPGSPPTYSGMPNNGPVYSLEMANSPDPNNAGNYVFYRDVVILPAGIGVALTCNTYTYNEYGVWSPNGFVNALDRYRRIGAIMFAPDGTLTTINFGVPLYETFTAAQYTTWQAGGQNPVSQLCSRIGMYENDLASNIPPNGSQNLPLISSVGFVVFDHDAYISQHATQQVAGVSAPSGDAFTDQDLNINLQPPVTAVPVKTTPAQDKFIEENWIDQNGTAWIVSPFNGSLIKAK